MTTQIEQFYFLSKMTSGPTPVFYAVLMGKIVVNLKKKKGPLHIPLCHEYTFRPKPFFQNYSKTTSEALRIKFMSEIAFVKYFLESCVSADVWFLSPLL